VHKAVSALESRAASFKHIQRGSGGALQFILSAQQAKQCLQIFTISDQDQE